MKYIVLGAFLLFSITSFSQKPDSTKLESWEKLYRASETKINDLVHTKLDVSFDFSQSWMYGKAWITLHPHFYATDSLNLDAKCMQINEVSLFQKGKHIPLKYTYDRLNLHITLDKIYRAEENYTVFIDYFAKPEDVKTLGSPAISGAKGLYFINPVGKDKNKPTQIWTQGETEANSVWFPTIDSPNQKTTNEISMTVPEKYQTLSNGLMTSRKSNKNGTRSDTWKMDLPHAPYLLMMAVGEFSISKDRYKGKEVSYYVEKEYAPVAKKIFGLTPEMMDYFSRITGVDYPWQKYAQVVIRDFVSGAMENTSATVHGEWAQQDERQLVDGNSWERVIAHELFHQWFGDYVTMESFSNISLNESLADFSETLWFTHKYGKDAGDDQNQKGLRTYLAAGGSDKDLVRFYYPNPGSLFDAVSYQKGGRILHMLRNQVGDSAFFKSLNLYLTEYKFQSAEAHQLRLAFEEVTGQDLNWFWNQWFFGSGHPILDISYDYDVAAKTAKVFIRQTQADMAFRFQIAVDVYQGTEKKRYQVWIDQKADTLSFPASSKPDLINVDGDKVLLCEKTDHKTLENFIFQYHHAGLYLDRREAIEFAATKQKEDAKALVLLKTALNDKYSGLRILAIQRLNLSNDSVRIVVEPLLADLAMNDPKSVVRASAIEALGKYKKDSYKELFLKSINDSSYSISGNALLALGAIDSVEALKQANILSAQQVKGSLSGAINQTLYMYSSENEFDSLAARFENFPFGNSKYMLVPPFGSYVKRIKNTDHFKKGIDLLVSFRDSIPVQYRDWIEGYINETLFKDIAASKAASGITEQAEYVNSKMPVKPKGK
jgi:aminopeptidase N